MSAYHNDPRVTMCLDETFQVIVDAVTKDAKHVCPGLLGGFVTHNVGDHETDGPGFDTADEAIRSLIGDPR